MSKRISLSNILVQFSDTGIQTLEKDGMTINEVVVLVSQKSDMSVLHRISLEKGISDSVYGNQGKHMSKYIIKNGERVLNPAERCVNILIYMLDD